jgi:hypothetical protein
MSENMAEVVNIVLPLVVGFGIAIFCVIRQAYKTKDASTISIFP